jgi:hypothetical protein
MSVEHGVTRARVAFGLRTFGAAALTVPADLEYDTRDPYAILLDFHSGTGSVEWLFGRDLLADGLLTPTGDGDVRISPGADPALVVFEISAPDGAAVLEASAQDLAAFLDCTYDLVPAGSESRWFDFDAELRKLAFRD